MRIIVDIGVNKTRYLIRKYQIDARIMVKKRIKWKEILIGEVSRNDDVSNLLVLISLIRLGVEWRRGVIWQWIIVWSRMLEVRRVSESRNSRPW